LRLLGNDIVVQIVLVVPIVTVILPAATPGPYAELFTSERIRGEGSRYSEIFQKFRKLRMGDFRKRRECDG